MCALVIEGKYDHLIAQNIHMLMNFCSVNTGHVIAIVINAYTV